MKRIWILLICISAAAFGQKRFDVTIESEDRIREAIISVPTTPPPSDGYPIVFMLHGTSGNAETYFNPVGWKELGQKENFITIFPSALRWCFYNRFDGRTINSRFVCGGLLGEICEDVEQDFVDDILFFKKLIKLVADTVKINPDKIFASGFSNGSSMTHKLMTNATDVFKVAAGSSSPLHELDSIVPPKRIPFWYVLGTKDDRYFSEKYPEELPFEGDTILGYVYGQLHRALDCNGLTEDYEKVAYPTSITYIFYQCKPGEECAPYVFTINKGQTHQFPNGINYPFDAPKLFWDFFNNPPKTKISTSTQQATHLQLKAYPVPASGSARIQLPGNQQFKVLVYDTEGRLLFQKPNVSNQIEIHTSEIGKGVFFVSAQSQDGVYQAKLVME